MTNEIITATEAVTRVGLKNIRLSAPDRKVVWSGYPQPFACGHYNDQGRRVSRHSCGGAVLFCWPSAPGELNTSLAISIEAESYGDRYEPDNNSKTNGHALTARWSG